MALTTEFLHHYYAWVTQCQRKHPKEKRKSPKDYAYAVRSFVGYLEGTEKALHTIRNYRSDLRSFEDFLSRGLGSRRVSLSKLTQDDLERYHGFLKQEGFKTNTRRRKLMTLRKLLGYLKIRKQISMDVSRKLATPHKVERVPQTLAYAEFLTAIRNLPSGSPILARNRVLLWTLAETGCQVSEISRITLDQWQDGERPVLQLGGKAPRALPVSRDLYAAVQALRSGAGASQKWIFSGFNKFGSMGGAITSRGIELLVRSHAVRLGYEELTPRTFRHTAVVHWFSEGQAREEIQRRLGLRTAYAFRIYEPLFLAISAKMAREPVKSSD